MFELKKRGMQWKDTFTGGCFPVDFFFPMRYTGFIQLKGEWHMEGFRSFDSFWAQGYGWRVFCHCGYNNKLFANQIKKMLIHHKGGLDSVFIF